MARFSRLVSSVALSAAMLFGAAASAEADTLPRRSPLEGVWLHVSSNAGFCEGCSVSITRSPDASPLTLLVTGSNGWRAEVHSRRGMRYEAAGFGCWCDVKHGPWAGKPFAISIDREGAEIGIVIHATDGSFPGIETAFRMAPQRPLGWPYRRYPLQPAPKR
jgi:hypothetical protein